VQGPKVAGFEQQAANILGAAFAVAVSSGTAALHVSLLGLGVGRGDIVVTTAYSWIATTNVIEMCGARPIFVDIDPETFNMAPPALGETLRGLTRDPTCAGRIKAILPVHTFGQMADMEAIMSLAAEYDLPVIEDAACALGAQQNGSSAGVLGRVGCFSFHPRKAVTTGEGGLCVTDDSALARRLRALRNHGQDPEATAPPEFIVPGLNYRLTDFQAALGATQLAKLQRILESRARQAGRYDDLLGETPVKIPAVKDGNRHVYQSYVVLLPKVLTARRDETIASLKKKGIETAIGTIHIPLSSYYRKRYEHREGDFPVTDDIFARSLALPLHEKLTEQEQQEVAGGLLGELGLA
ncbi:MAG TPA: DegT/DnrJ/EryC1/StrS family aminotransferase, partial [Phycisphaerae bacterium]|nr:DegT/DnrJ/EryC1/StrS family aminotransferase [Phycisphaerae bacterium]